MKNLKTKLIAVGVTTVTVASLMPMAFAAQADPSQTSFNPQNQQGLMQGRMGNRGQKFNNQNHQRLNLQNMTFEERQTFILGRLDRNIERLTTRLGNIDNLPVSDEIKNNIKSHLPERITALKAEKEKVKQAKTDEDLIALRDARKKEVQAHREEIKAKMGGTMPFFNQRNNGRQGRRGGMGLFQNK